VLLADVEKAKLLRCGLTVNGRCHVETVDTIQNDWPGHDHPKSSPLWKNTTVSYGVEDNESPEETRRFVREVNEWLKRKMKIHAIKSIVILAPPSITGVFRKTKFASTHPTSIVTHKGELVNLPVHKLARHAAIQGLVDAELVAEQV
jgi:protein required for attachment to host cells